MATVILFSNKWKLLGSQRKTRARSIKINTWHFIAWPPNFPNQIKNINSFLQILETSLNLETSSDWPWGVQSNEKPSTLPQILSASGGSFQNSELTRSVRLVLPLALKDDRYYFRIFFIESNEVTNFSNSSLRTCDKIPVILVLQHAATHFTCNNQVCLTTYMCLHKAE